MRLTIVLVLSFSFVNPVKSQSFTDFYEKYRVVLGDSTMNSLETSTEKIYISHWASWCYPCLANIKFLNRLTALCEESNTTVVTISLDNSQNSWLSAMEKFDLSADYNFNPQTELQLKVLDEGLEVSSLPYYVILNFKTKTVTSNAHGPSFPLISKQLGCK